MRIAIAKVIFCEPEILMLDEPTNHLDINAVAWLEDYINCLDITVVVISHARDFLNAVVDEIIFFQNQKLVYYKGDFDQFEKVKNEKDDLQRRQKVCQDKKVAHVQQFIDRFRANNKRASMVQSRIKALEKMEVIDDVVEDPDVVFNFPAPEKLNPPMIRLDEASIGWAADRIILKDVNIHLDQETRICLVGPNGAGKSTLLKALVGELGVLAGKQFVHNRVRVGIFTQHHVDLLDLKLTAVEQLLLEFPGTHHEQIRAHLGSFGLSGPLALKPMYLLSGGQKSRVAFAKITWTRPHILMLDEPTNHLDFDAINALIDALNRYEGGLIVVSHDQYFLNSVCDRIYVIKNKRVKLFDGTIEDYKRQLLDN